MPSWPGPGSYGQQKPDYEPNDPYRGLDRDDNSSIGKDASFSQGAFGGLTGGTASSGGGNGRKNDAGQPGRRSSRYFNGRR